MNGPLEFALNEVTAHGTAPRQRGSVPNLASFARALREHGLLMRFDAPPAITGGWNDTPDLWTSANAVYEAHLRRVGMEQVMATLRRDGGEDT